MRWRTDQALSIATSQRLAHTVGANDLFVRLDAAARTMPDAELSTLVGRALLQGTAHRDRPQPLRPTDAIWSPLDAEGVRLRLGELAGWPRPAESSARLVRAADGREAG